MSRPIDALDVQNDLVGWWRSPEGLRWNRSFAKAYALDSQAESEVAEAARHIAEAVAAWGAQADTYWCSESIVGCVANAAETMPRQPLLTTDLPSAAGFLWLERPLYTVDVRGMPAAIRCLLWTPAVNGESGRSGVFLSWLSDCLDPCDDEGQQIYREVHDQGSRMPRYVPYHGDLLTFDRPVHQSGAKPGSPDLLTNWIVAFWSWCKQDIPRIERREPDRPMRRRIERMGRPASPVLIVTLRREASQRAEPSDSLIEWTHRWIVRGHWRNQWYPTQEAHRAIWIDPYVKGPEDAPLVVRERVAAVSR